MINYGRQDISQEDIDAVVTVLNSDFLTQGPAVTRFENAIATKVNAIEAIAVNNATNALHIACLSLGLGKGDYLWTSPISFVASSNCALYCGASVDFVDIDKNTYNMSPKLLEKKLFEAKKLGKLPKIVVPVHLCGNPCDMRKIHALSIEYGFKIIEDASHSIGAFYDDHPVGSCKFSDITIFSFHPVKIITTGEGGMALTNDLELAEKMRLLRSHGITRDPNEFIGCHVEQGPWYYEQIELGFNYRMTDIQAALGLSQLSRLDKFVKKRNELAEHYQSIFSHNPLIGRPKLSDQSLSSFHLYVVQIEFENTIPKTDLFRLMKNDGINLNLHYIPIHTQPYYLNLGFKLGDFPVAENFYNAAVTLPLHPSLTKIDVSHISEKINEYIK